MELVLNNVDSYFNSVLLNHLYCICTQIILINHDGSRTTPLVECVLSNVDSYFNRILLHNLYCICIQIAVINAEHLGRVIVLSLLVVLIAYATIVRLRVKYTFVFYLLKWSRHEKTLSDAKLCESAELEVEYELIHLCISSLLV